MINFNPKCLRLSEKFLLQSNIGRMSHRGWGSELCDLLRAYQVKKTDELIVVALIANSVSTCIKFSSKTGEYIVCSVNVMRGCCVDSNIVLLPLLSFFTKLSSNGYLEFVNEESEE